MTEGAAVQEGDVPLRVQWKQFCEPALYDPRADHQQGQRRGRDRRCAAVQQLGETENVVSVLVGQPHNLQRGHLLGNTGDLKINELLFIKHRADQTMPAG